MTMPLWDCRESEIAALMTLRIAGSVHAMLRANRACPALQHAR